MIDPLTRALLLRYQPNSPLLNEPAQEPPQAPVSPETSKQALTQDLAHKIALMEAQGASQVIIDILKLQLKVNLAEESK